MILNLQESAILASIGLIIGMLHATVCEPRQNSSQENFFQTVESVMDSVKNKTKNSPLLSVWRYTYVVCFWFGIILFLLNICLESKEIIFAYLK